MRGERHSERPAVSVNRGGAIHDHHVEPGEVFLVLPEGFADDALYLVSSTGFSALFFGDGQTKSCIFQMVAPTQDREIAVPTAARFRKHAIISACVQ